MPNRRNRGRSGACAAPARWFVIAVLAAAAVPATVAAQAYPAKPVRMVVPFSPGGTLDQLARMVGQGLSDAWGQPVLVENRPGSGGNPGTEIVARAAPDGYTLLMISVGLASNPALYRKLAFDAARDLAPVTLVATSQNVLVVHPSVPAKTVRDLVRLAKARPGQLNFSSSGNGTSQHLAGELFKSMAGVQMQHIPYRGGPQGLTALIGGEASLMFNNLVTALPYVEAGRLRALAVTSARRSAVAPQIPTIGESGLPGFDVSTWYGLLVPAGTPGEILARINRDVVRILGLAESRERMRNAVDLTPSTPEEFARHLRDETVKWAKVVRDSGARAE